ncbi:MAG: 50S ribosomal protein L34e [Methanosphaera stadtmanae]|jgi:large subunit ribosomal protein L34e|nr:50S ribosomal protein L34e [Methanosphaera stadtmanae]
MSAPRHRTKTFKRVLKRVPGGRQAVHYKKKRPSKHVCAKCGKVLDGVPRGRPYEIKKLSKNQRRPNRPYGGQYCTNCTKQLLKEEARSL